MSGPIRIGSPALSPFPPRRRLISAPLLLTALLSSLLLLLLLSGLPHQRQLPLAYPASLAYSPPAAVEEEAPSAGGYGLTAGPFHAPPQAGFRAGVLRRLDALVEQDIRSHNDSLARQAELCPNAQLRVDRDHYLRNVDWWSTVGVAELRGMRARVADAIKAEFNWTAGPTTDETALIPQQDEEPLVPWRARFGHGGRGIVYTAGNSDTISRLIVSLTVLRRDYGCALPVEIFVFPDEMDRINARERRRVDRLGGVTWRRAKAQKTGKRG